jgi:hypothetical protein
MEKMVSSTIVTVVFTHSQQYVITNQNEMKLHKKYYTTSANSYFKNTQLQNNVHFRLTNTAKLQVPTLHPYTENSGY